MGGFESQGNDVHAAGAERKGSSLRVLIVDDHMLFAEAIRSAVAGVGIEVVAVATTGEEGVKEVRRSRPDLVLMDVVLPDQSGLAAGRRILDEVPDTKILALTALDDQSVGSDLRILFRSANRIVATLRTSGAGADVSRAGQRPRFSSASDPLIPSGPPGGGAASVAERASVSSGSDMAGASGSSARS